MTNRRKEWWSMLVLICAFGFVVSRTAVGADAQCSKLEIPDLDALKLADGEHTVAAVDAPFGKFEARVTVKRGIVSDPRYFIRNKRLKKTSESKVPSQLRECLDMQQKGESSSSFSLNPLDWIAPPVEAADTRLLCRPKTVWGQCWDHPKGGGMCCAKACCTTGTRSCSSACVFF